MVAVPGLSGRGFSQTVTIGDDAWPSTYYGHYRDIVISSVLAIPLLVLISVAVLIDPFVNRWSA